MNHANVDFSFTSFMCIYYRHLPVSISNAEVGVQPVTVQGSTILLAPSLLKISRPCGEFARSRSHMGVLIYCNCHDCQVSIQHSLL